MSENRPEEIKAFTETFVNAFWKNWDAAKISGAIDSSQTNIELARCIFVITARYFEPMSDYNRKQLSNLSHFV